MTAALLDRQQLVKPETPLLFQVWFDVDCGMRPEPSWWWNSEPQPLRDALQEAAEARAEG